MNRISRNITPLSATFWCWHLLLPTVLFLLAVVGCELSDIDLNLADRFFDFSTGQWPAREAWWAEWLIHKRGKDLIVLIAAGSLLLWLGSFRWGRLRHYRWLALYLALAIVLSTSIVTTGKKLIGKHCPWDLDRYGGVVPHTRLLEKLPPGCRPGNCFPAGHAAGGFAIMAGYFAWRDRRRGVAQSWLAAGLLLGSIYGYGQMARGAHFLSHNIWSAMICWLSALALYIAMRRLLAEESR
ncbi:MAG: phosphatase PAP2 family protein [Desulfuromonadaceae bacterium]